MLGIGQKFPQFSLTGVVSNDQSKAFQPFTQDSARGKWQVFFFWPKDFTFVCPTEIAAFGKLDKEFKARDAQLYGASVDSEFVHLAWERYDLLTTDEAFYRKPTQAFFEMVKSEWLRKVIAKMPADSTYRPTMIRSLGSLPRAGFSTMSVMRTTG